MRDNSFEIQRTQKIYANLCQMFLTYCHANYYSFTCFRMNEFDILWEDSKTSLGRYKSNNVFEDIYIQILAPDLTYESVWDCLKKNCVKMYKYNPVFENEFLSIYPIIAFEYYILSFF